MNREPSGVGRLASVGAVGLFSGWLVAIATRPLSAPFRLTALVMCLALLVRRSR